MLVYRDCSQLFGPSKMDRFWKGLPKADIGATAANAHFVRVLPLDAECSERPTGLDPPFMHHAAKVSGEPILPNAAQHANGCT